MSTLAHRPRLGLAFVLNAEYRSRSAEGRGHEQEGGLTNWPLRNRASVSRISRHGFGLSPLHRIVVVVIESSDRRRVFSSVSLCTSARKMENFRPLRDRANVVCVECHSRKVCQRWTSGPFGN